jgi:hypothetical protein
MAEEGRIDGLDDHPWMEQLGRDLARNGASAGERPVERPVVPGYGTCLGATGYQRRLDLACT